MPRTSGSVIKQLDGNIDTCSESEMESSSDNEGINLIKNEYAVRLLLTNARSLRPKIDSLNDAFGSLGLNIACITETWYKGGRDLSEHLRDIEGSSGIRILHKSRDGRLKKVGGGVAVAFDLGSCNLKIRNLRHMPSRFEVMCVAGVVGKVSRKVVVFVVYIPPTMKATELEELREAIAIEVGAAKKSYKNPLVMITGDFNHRDVGAALNEVEEFTQIVMDPTRGGNTIDVIYTNQPLAHCETRVLPPLEATNGAVSDHRCVFTEASFPPVRGYHWITQMRRTRDTAREEAFARELGTWDWECFGRDHDVDGMAGVLEDVILKLTDKHFPLVRVRRRSNESPWITKRVRRLWKRKIRLYKKGGKSQLWWNTERKMQVSLSEARSGFVERMLEDGNMGRSFYSTAKKMSSAAPTPQWSVMDLFPGQDPDSVGKEVLEFYGNISHRSAEPMPELATRHGGLEEFTVEKTVELLRQMKKTESRVEGDPLPHLARKYPEAFAVPVAAIFNEINRSGSWPIKWKTEHLTIIPKVPNPGSLSECRNISCTSAFSKVLEGVVLLKLRSELSQDRGQYGGTPKCGAEHMLVDMWERIMEALEGGKNAAILLGVDYEKAFNRMEHSVCLDRLRRLGASEGSIALVRAFLQDRRMTISIEGHGAPPVKIDRGSPQGSVLGCALYCVTTQLLTKDLRNSHLPVAHETVHGQATNSATSFLYVDDTTLFDAVPMSQSVKHFTTSRTVEVFQQPQIVGDFDELSSRAADIGMAINGKKTQLLVISPPNGCTTSATAATRNGDTISSVDTMKLVGFTFGSSPCAGAHVAAIGDKYGMKKWMLYHLRDSGFRGEDLYKLYCCYVRSVIEYCSPVYNSLLNQGQEVYLERLQRHALRVCFGYDRPVEDWMQQHNISTLKDRRVRRCDKFIRKASKNPRFGPTWLPPRVSIKQGLRARRGIQETQARSLRRFNSPFVFPEEKGEPDWNNPGSVGDRGNGSSERGTCRGITPNATPDTRKAAGRMSTEV